MNENGSTTVALVVCVNRRHGSQAVSCAQAGGEEIAALLKKKCDCERYRQVEVRTMRCLGECKLGPNVRLAPGGPFFHRVDVNELQEIFNALDEMLKNRSNQNGS